MKFYDTPLKWLFEAFKNHFTAKHSVDKVGNKMI